MDDMDSDVAAALRSSIVRDKHAAVRSASIVLLSGFLESFLRQCAEVFFDELERKGVRYADLPVSMHKIHFVVGLAEAQKVAKVDDDDFSQTMATLGKLADPRTRDLPDLYWKAFAVTKGNPGPEVLTEYLKNFGVKDPLQVVGAMVKLDATFIRLNLQSFISLRNECAHSGKTKKTPSTQDVRDFVHFLRQLTLGISRVLEVVVRDLCRQAVENRA